MYHCFCIGWKTQDRFKELTGETLAMGHCLKTLTLEMGISVETHSSGTCIVETHSSYWKVDMVELKDNYFNH
jgi:hypothetical protein